MSRIAKALALVAVVVSAGLVCLRFIDFDSVLLLGVVGIAPALLAVSLFFFAGLFGGRQLAITTVGLLLVGALALPGTFVPRLGCDVTQGEPDDIVVFSHNTLGGKSDIAAAAAQIERVSPDIMLLQETTPSELRALRAALADRYPHYEGEGSLHVLSSVPLAERFVTGTSTGGVLVVSASFDQVELRLANMHPSAPVVDWRRMNQREELEAVPVWSEAENVELLMGDFNASAAHRVLRNAIDERYVDAHRAAGCGTGLTWAPTVNRVPLLSLDHAFVDTSAFEAVSFEVLDYAGSDHKAIAVRLRANP